MRARLRTFRDLGTAIKDAREASGLSQEELADELGIPRQYVVRMERGVSNLYVTRLFRALKALDIEVTVTWRQSAEDR